MTPPIPQPRPTSPWPTPPQLPPSGPSYTSDAAERAEARRRLARYDGDLDRQAGSALSCIQGRLSNLVRHLEEDPECTPTCAVLASELRAMVAYSAAFDAAGERARAQRRGELAAFNERRAAA